MDIPENQIVLKPGKLIDPSQKTDGRQTRTCQLLVRINSGVPVFIDSPLGIRITQPPHDQQITDVRQVRLLTTKTLIL